MVCHRELFERRPASRYLTEFYLWMSFGGVLGGVFSALIAPQIFNSIWEYPLLLILAMACRPGVTARLDGKELRDLLGIAGLAIVAMCLVVELYRFNIIDFGDSNLLRLVMLFGFGGLALLQRGKPVPQLVYIALATADARRAAFADEPRRRRAQLLRHPSRGEQPRWLDPLPVARHHHPRRRATGVEGRLTHQ